MKKLKQDKHLNTAVSKHPNVAVSLGSCSSAGGGLSTDTFGAFGGGNPL